MLNGLTIKKNYKNFNNKNILEFLNPCRIYIPLVVYNDFECEASVKTGDCVLKGSVIGISKKFDIPIHSSVSGTVIEIKVQNYIDGKDVQTIIIDNDFKEQCVNNNGVKLNISKYNKNEFINNIKNNAIVGMGGSGFPTFIKYQSSGIDTIILNGVECEPIITSDYYLMAVKAEEILEAMDAVMEINHVSKGIIAIKELYKDLIQVFDKLMGTYPNIKVMVVKDYYPAGYEKHLVKMCTGKECGKLPSEVGVIVSNPATIYAMYESLKYNKPISKRLITVFNFHDKKSYNVWVKIGTMTQDILQFLQINNDEDNVIIAGGPMMGNSVSLADFPVTKNCNNIIIMPFDREKVLPNCLRCGKCITVCPVNLAPVLIKDATDNKEALVALNPEKCIECGLCSYICPSKINVREYVKDAKKEVK